RSTRRELLGEIGSLIETPPGYTHLTGAENMRIVQRLLDLDDQHIDAAVRTVRMHDQMDKKVREFSLGMKQRLGIAMALARRPKLLILDEPTNGLDPAGIEEIRELLRQLAEGGVTVMVSSHLLGEIDKTATVLGILSQGRLIFQGTRRDLFSAATPDLLIDASDPRREHRGSNWNALMAGPTSSLRAVLAKAGAVAVLAALMQVIAVATVTALGTLAFGLPGALPAEYLGVSLLIVVACVPVAVLQSGLSMLLRSFAAPVAVAFLGAGVSALLLVGELDASVLVSPYGAVSRATQLGTGTFADTGDIALTTVSLIAVASLVQALVFAAASTTVLERSDTRT